MENFNLDRAFTKRLLPGGTWAIEGITESPFTHVILGSEKAMVIDPGMHRRNIHDYIREEITDLPLIVVNTHGHFDHTGSNGQFKDYPIYMSPHAATECKNVFGHRNPADYCLDYTPTAIEEGHMFDIGGRLIETFALPCHSPGSYSFLDKTRGILFTGDELESGQVLIGRGYVEGYLKNMQKLKARVSEFDTICPAHNGTPIDISYIDRFMENALRIMDGHEGSLEIGSPTYMRPDDSRRNMPGVEKLRRSEWKGANLVYNMEQIFLAK